jgi:hypothetical protein
MFPMNWFRAAFSSLVLLGAVPFPADAAPILITSGGELIGANGVLVNGTLYDVEFVRHGGCPDDGCDEQSDFTFQTLAAASAASQALLDQVFLDGGTAATAYDSNPALTAFCANPDICYTYTYYQPAPALDPVVGPAYATARNTSETTDLLVDGITGMFGFPLGLPPDTPAFTVAAKWSTVPEPSTALLFGSAFALLQVVRLRRKSSK